MPDRLLLLVLVTLSLAALLLATPGRRTAVAQRPDASVRLTRVLGASVHHRSISVVVRGDPDTPVKELVIGCIHGNEPAGIAIAEDLESVPLRRELGLWIVEDANPDGVAAGHRTNAHSVDLNRNFPWRWQQHGQPGDPTFTGPRPLSEPESRLLADLIRRLRPRVTIWFHQPLALVDESGGNLRVERRYASLVHLPLRRLPRYPGGATDWQNARSRHTTAFVVELPQGPLGLQAARRFADAAASLLRLR